MTTTTERARPGRSPKPRRVSELELIQAVQHGIEWATCVAWGGYQQSLRNARWHNSYVGSADSELSRRLSEAIGLAIVERLHMRSWERASRLALECPATAALLGDALDTLIWRATPVRTAMLETGEELFLQNVMDAGTPYLQWFWDNHQPVTGCAATTLFEAEAAVLEQLGPSGLRADWIPMHQAAAQWMAR